ncbi:MAG: serine hydrolase, partial [Myxococcales bacterium]|nr:serine hydrolase [Myxococcales bacterium]
MKTVQALDSLLAQAVADGVTPGCVALVRRDGRTLVHTAHGSLATHPAAPVHGPVTIDTVYDLASLTKVLSTTTLVAQAVARGELELDAIIRRVKETLR